MYIQFQAHEAYNLARAYVQMQLIAFLLVHILHQPLLTVLLLLQLVNLAVRIKIHHLLTSMAHHKPLMPLVEAVMPIMVVVD